ncbi:hypothetical protein BG011_005619 [Mortierella polycephala]|uniref:Galactose oxidase n=1 Tax=Mortierella polycephala TaxID=41804 RepID=A0A9P6PY79_9FUNG|nr:hypothetical protein BG011_005619 [Mortierella polycephala]
MLFRILNLSILFGFVTHHVTSQIPMTCTRMAYVTDSRKTLYIHGGNCEGFGASQLFSLDLTQQSLTKSMPSWKELTPAQGSATPPAAEAHSMTISQDSRTLTLWVGDLTYSFNLMTMTWTGPEILSKNATNCPALRAVKDLRSGDVYVPEGYNEGTQMAIYRYNGRFSWAPMPTAAVMPLESWLYSAVWSTLRGTMLLYGGNDLDSDQGSQFLVEYDPRTNAWSRIPTRGISPGDIYNHCMVPAYNGTKMVVFGGQHNKMVGSLGSIYVLDLESMSWTKGADVDRALWRSNMACTVAGDNFVAWGGKVNYGIEIYL